MSNYYLVRNILALLLFASTQITVLAQVEKLANWDGVNTANTIFPYAGKTIAPLLVSATQNYNGLTTDNDGRNVWYVQNPSAAVDINSAPYLSYSLTFKETGSINFDRIVMNGLAAWGNGNVKLQLRWSVDNFASSLGEFTISGNYITTSVNVAKTVEVSQVEFRVYFYNATYAYVYLTDDGSPVGDGTPDSYIERSSVAIWHKTGTATTIPDSEAAPSIKVYSSLERNTLVIENNCTSDEYNIAVFNMAGLQVYSKVTHLTRGKNSILVSNIKAGQYIVSIQGKQVNSHQKVIMK